MLSNPYSIAILIFSGLLIFWAVSSKSLREMHKKDVKALEDKIEGLSKEEKAAKKKTESWVIIAIELSILALIIGGFYVSKG